MFKLVILGFVVVAAVVAYKLWKAHKVVTAGTVLAGVESDVKTEVAAVKTDVASTVANDVTKSL